MKPRIAIATEGPASKAVLEAICDAQGVIHRILAAEGKDKLFKEFPKMLRAIEITFRANRFIVVPDLHPQVDCVAEAMRWNMEIAKRFSEARLCLAIWETESWLLADPKAIQAYLGTDVKVPDPDQTGGESPSGWVQDTFRRIKGYTRGAAFDKRTDGANIARGLDIQVATKRSPSLKRFVLLAR